MRFRLGFTLGFGAGYYLGAKAGKERYQEMRTWIEQFKRSEAYETAEGKTKAVIDLGVERARGLVDDRRSASGSEVTPPGTVSDINDPMPST